MTNFLQAGIINETLEQICEKIAELKLLLDKGEAEKVREGLDKLEETALDLWVFIEKFSCKPLIYTGKGNTDEIIRRLEWALTFIEGIDSVEYINYLEKEKKKHSR